MGGEARKEQLVHEGYQVGAAGQALIEIPYACQYVLFCCLHGLRHLRA